MGTVSTSLPADGQTIDASDVNTPINAILAEFNGNIDNDNIKTAANINGSKLGAATTPLSVLDADGKAGWITGVLAAPNTVTNNGNRSYDVVFNSVDYTDELSAGMRLRLTRTVSAPTQCADLEASSSQYFSKTSPAGISFTTTFTCSAWVKLESYTLGGIIARRNADTEGWSLAVAADGRIQLLGQRIASNNKAIASYQSIPLNKWVHVAACLDMTAADTTAQKIWIDGVEVPRAYTLTGTATAIVQGTTALVVGALKSDGTSPFDGKIAQASVHSACLSTAQIQAMMSQTISSSSPSIVSGFTLSDSLVDVNTSNANDVSPSGVALATNVDSPFGNYLGGTLEYAIITKTAFSTNTTLTVQVPEGCAIPTSGGVSAVAYSTQKAPYGFPADEGQWEIISLHKSQQSQAAATVSVWYNVGSVKITVPVGAWDVTTMCPLLFSGAVAGAFTASTSLSTGASSESNTEFTSSINAANTLQLSATVTKSRPIKVSSATDYYQVEKYSQNTGGGAVGLFLLSNESPLIISLTPANL